MTITTKFNLGDRVLAAGKPFTIGQIQIRTMGANLILIEYRSVAKNSVGIWHAERFISEVADAPGTCSRCGSPLVYVAGPHLTATVCPVCDQDSAALDPEP